MRDTTKIIKIIGIILAIATAAQYYWLVFSPYQFASDDAKFGFLMAILIQSFIAGLMIIKND